MAHYSTAWYKRPAVESGNSPRIDSFRMTGGPIPLDMFLTKICFPDAGLPECKPYKLRSFRTLLNKIDPAAETCDKLVEALNHVAQDALPKQPRHAEFRTYNIRRDLSPSDQVSSRPSYISVMHDDQIPEDAHWSRALSFIQVNPTAAHDVHHPSTQRGPDEWWDAYETRVDTWNDMQAYASVAFRARPRTFLLGVALFGDRARLYYWDRTCILLSAAFDWKKDPAPLVQFIIGISLHGDRGIDATADTPVIDAAEQELIRSSYQRAVELRILTKYTPRRQGGTLINESIRIDIPRKGAEGEYDSFVTVGPPLAASKDLHGVGTRVWLATKVDTFPGEEDSEFVIIKDAWRDTERAWTEGQVYDAIYAGKAVVRGVARFDNDVDVVDRRTGRPQRMGGIPFTEMDGHRKMVPIDLVHHRCILRSVGIPLTRFKSTRQLLEAIRDAVEGHKAMNENGVMHRDISVNNILISADPDKEGGAKGFLIDPEYAIARGMPNYDEELKADVGTPSFVACAKAGYHQGDVAHKPWHDLESFFWVTLYVVLCHTRCTMRARYDGIGDPGVSRPPGCDFVYKVFDPERRELGQLFLEKDLGTLVVEDNAPLTACLIKLGEMAVSMYEHPVETLLPEEKRAQFFAEHRNKMTHESFISTIQGALDADGWPDEAADGPIPYLNIVKDTKYFALLAFKQMVDRPRVIRRALPETLQEAEQPTVPGDQEAIPERKSRERNTRGKEAAAMARPAQKRRKDQKRKVAQDEDAIVTGTRHRKDPGSAAPVAPKKRKQVTAGDDEARAGSRKKRARQTDTDAIATRTRAAVKKTEASRRQGRRGKV